jgi:hypothetical protein
MVDPKEAFKNTEEFQMDLLNVFLNSDLTARSYLGVPKDYMTSELKKEKYEVIAREDQNFEEFVKLKYGSLENFYSFNPQLKEERIYNPLTDYDMEVEIITEDEYLKTNFLSSPELFMEVLGGITTIQYVKVDGNAAQLVGTLKKSYVPSSQYETRDKAFGFFGGKRILLWDLTKQDWSSVYIQNIRRFIRDDTTELQ